MSGVIHCGQKRQIKYKEYPYTDVTVYEVPYSGEADSIAIQAALAEKNTTRTLYNLHSINTTRKILEIEVQQFIKERT